MSENGIENIGIGASLTFGRTFKVHKYGIVADNLNILPANFYVLISAEKSEKAAFAEYYDTAYLCGRRVKFYIIDKSYSAAGFDADYFFASYIAEMAHHSITVR